MTAKPTSLRLIVGLGNPGPSYKETRHNAGAWLIETLCAQHHLSLKVEPKLNVTWTEWTFNGNKFYLLIPTTYMNLCGQAISAFAKYYQIAPDTMMVAHDELDIPVGDYRFKSGGGHAGHNGLRDLILHLNSREFHRIRIGIGHPGDKDAVSDYVLNKPPKAEKEKIMTAIDGAITTLEETLNAKTKGLKDGI